MIDKYIAHILQKKETGKQIEDAQKKARHLKAYYTGEGKIIEEVLLNYRISEKENQKNQRKRISILRTKATIRKIENILNQLDIMDKPAVNVIGNDKQVEDIKRWIYANNIEKFAFKTVEYYNLVDSNSFVIASINQYGDLEFKPYGSESLYDVYHINGVLKIVTLRSKRLAEKKEVYDYHIYTNQYVITLADKSEASRHYEVSESTPEIDGFYIVAQPVNMIYAFKLGYLPDATTDGKLSMSILEPASELFKSLVWEGSEFDTTKGTHGILKHFTYSKVCNHREELTGQTMYCQGGYMMIGGVLSTTKCRSCQGSGMQIHTSSQDVIHYPLPGVGETPPMKLSDLSHTVFVPENFLQFRKQEIEDITTEIMHTIFNTSTFTKDEVAATATEKVIDLQGVYATLSELGKQVSDFFIWMCEIYCDIKGYKDIKILHGYTLSLKLETIEDLAMKRKTLVEANAPIEVIQAVDLAILQKQHIDSPEAINNFVIWEQHRPFSDKSETVTLSILSGLPAKDRYKILYNFWGMIKNNILVTVGDKWYAMPFDKRQAYIDAEVDKIIAKMEPEPQNTFEAFG